MEAIFGEGMIEKMYYKSLMMTKAKPISQIKSR